MAAKRKATETMRLTIRTLAAINIIRAELSAETGERISQDEAVWAMIERSFPEIATRLVRKMEHGSNGENASKGEDGDKRE